MSFDPDSCYLSLGGNKEMAGEGLVEGGAPDK